MKNNTNFHPLVERTRKHAAKTPAIQTVVKLAQALNISSENLVKE